MRIRAGSGSNTFCNTPDILSTLDNAAVGRLDILSRPYDGEGNGIDQDTSVLSASLVIGLNRRGIDTDALSRNNVTNLA